MLIVHGLLLAIRCHARFGASGLVASADLNDPSVSQVTIRCLLQHTAGGWSNAAPDPMMSNAGLSHSALIIHTVTVDPAQRLSAPPGTRYAYSNFGYCVLARCIEARDPQHRNYATHVQQEVFDRMGLTASDEFAFAMSEQAPVSKEASAYCTRPALPPGANAAPVEPAWIIADASAGPEPSIARMDAHGGWVASATGVVRFCAQIPTVLTAQSVEIMRAGSLASPGYGLGWSVNPDHSNAWHTGSLPGTSAMMISTGVPEASA